MKGCTVSGEVIAVYGGWGTEPEPVYGGTGGIVRAAAEENTVPGEVVAGYVGWVTGPVYFATGAERAKGGTVRGATEGDPVRGAAEGSTVPGGVIAGYVGWVTEAVYGATGTVRATGGTVCGATAGGGRQWLLNPSAVLYEQYINPCVQGGGQRRLLLRP